ncbi:MAG: hypothetical protein IJ092_02730 [Atopobiaceae bacterium]|nr:hypothetical protein [Atopobiaceae bacterium]MBR1828007.1 hypothetical protein [Atopobiaceae bacterium]
MAANNNGWNSFMQSKQARIILNGFCAAICAVYTFDAVRELLSGGNAMLIEQIGQGPYTALTVVRGLVCAWVAFVFGRMTYKTFMEKDDDRR